MLDHTVGQCYPECMYINGILNVNVLVRSIEDVRHFYTEALGLPLANESAGILSFYYGQTSFNVLQASDADRSLIGRRTGIGLRTQRDSDIIPIPKRLHKQSNTSVSIQAGSWANGSRATVTDPCQNELTIWGCRGEEYDDYPHLFEGSATVAIQTSDLRRSLAFYYGLLQLPMMEQTHPGYAMFFHQGTRLIVTEKDAWDVTEAAQGETGICFDVNDLDSLVQNLNHNGVALNESVQGTDQVRGASVHDPDGNQIAFLSKN